MHEQWQGKNYLNISTRKKDGSRVDTPVWFAPKDENTFYLFSAGDAGKVKRIRNFSDVRICPCTMTGKLLGEWQDAKATLLDDAESRAAHETLKKHYGWQMRLVDFGASLTGRISKRAFIRLDLADT